MRAHATLYCEAGFCRDAGCKEVISLHGPFPPGWDPLNQEEENMRTDRSESAPMWAWRATGGLAAIVIATVAAMGCGSSHHNNGGIASIQFSSTSTADATASTIAVDH